MATRGIRDCEKLLVIRLTTIDISASSEKVSNYITVLNNIALQIHYYSPENNFKSLKIHFLYIFTCIRHNSVAQTT